MVREYIQNHGLREIHSWTNWQPQGIIVAVALGLFAYSLVSIFVNVFQMYKLYPFALGVINSIVFYMLKYFFRKRGSANCMMEPLVGNLAPL